jgi:mannonate dehydratase
VPIYTWKPKIAENLPTLDGVLLRWAAQLGLDAIALGGRHVDPNGLGYWTEESLRAVMDKARAHNLEVGIIMLHNVTPNIILGKPGRDEDIAKVIKSIRAAGAAGLPVIEYNFYNHRAIEGYAQQPGRGGSRYTDYDDARVQVLPVLPEVGTPTAEETWERLRYFLKAVTPVADEYGIRMALHPNDPPPPLSRGAAQVTHGFEGMKKLIDLVDSPANGITFCQGSFAEWGVDVAEAIRYFGGRDRIHHVHFRNPKGLFPKYVETWLDEGDTDMFRAMKAYRDVKYRFTFCSDHVPGMTDNEHEDSMPRSYGEAFNRIGRAFNHGYIRALIQAVNSAG